MLNYDDIYDFFFNGEMPDDAFTRIKREYFLDIYLGFNRDYRPTLLILFDFDQEINLASSLISVHLGKRNDGKKTLSFTLLDSKYIELFSWFCLDLINSSRHFSDQKKGVNFICERYKKWQKMLSKTNGFLLRENEIKGLLGELFFLKNNLSKRYGYEKSLQSWIGPNRAYQDFVCEDCWYEIKSTSSGSNRVKISSIEQLDTETEGKLVVIFLDKTSYADFNKISINSYVEEIKKELPEERLITLFEDRLLDLGYHYFHEYDKYSFKYSGHSIYRVNRKFPCIRDQAIPKSVCNVKYDLLLDSIYDWREKCE